MIHFLESDFDDNRKLWCKNNGIFYLTAWKVLFPVLCVTIGLMSDRKIEEWLSRIIIFNSADAMAYKLRWG